MNLKEIIQEFCRRTGLPVPLSVATSGDVQVLQLMGLLNEVLEDLQERKAFSFLQTEATFLSTAMEVQGEIKTLAPGFVRLLDNLLYNRTSREVIFGSIPPAEWQIHKSGIWEISETKFRIQQGMLKFLPVPEAGSTIAFEYVTAAPVFSGITYKQYFTADTDTCLYPDDLLILGLRWIWRREKGMRYLENKRDYEYKVSNLAGNDGTSQPIPLDSVSPSGPSINVPERSWNLS